MESIATDLSLAEELGFNPYYPQVTARSGGRVMIDGSWYIDCASNDYLGLALDEGLRNVYYDAIDRFGVSLCGTPIAAGGNRLLSDMEERLAAFTGCEAAMTFPSCYQANTSLFTALFGKEDCVFIDHFAHASLIAGVKASGCRIMPFLHNDCDHLEKLLKRQNGCRQKVVVTESVFSTEGSIAPFNRIYDLCRKYNALPVIDDSHGIGVIGKNGAGILSFCSLTDFNGIYTTSLGKALANSGGIIAGKKYIIDGLKYHCSGTMYSTGIAPAVAAGIVYIIDKLIVDFDTLHQQLQDNCTLLRTTLERRNHTLSAGASPIIAVQCGSMRSTITFARQLFESKIVATPFVEPSVPPNRGVVRIIPGAAINGELCRKAAKAIETIRK